MLSILFTGCIHLQRRKLKDSLKDFPDYRQDQFTTQLDQFI